MLHDPRVKNLSFTGSTEVGRVLLKEAADRVIRCSMELGGNAQVVIHDDADFSGDNSAAFSCKDAQRWALHVHLQTESLSNVGLQICSLQR
jgi:acyl-CoA reductase-like NAD-dependent aldehyde dehydrogenase